MENQHALLQEDMVTIEIKIHLNRGAAFCTKPRACFFFFFVVVVPKDDKRGLEMC